MGCGGSSDKPSSRPNLTVKPGGEGSRGGAGAKNTPAE